MHLFLILKILMTSLKHSKKIQIIKSNQIEKEQLMTSKIKIKEMDRQKVFREEEK